MTGLGAPGSTVLLLDGAINLGFASIEKQLARPDLTLAAYIVALVGAYHTSVNTPRNLLRASARFEKLGRPEVAAYLEERAREETGHDRLALKDLRALGVPGEKLVANYIPEGIKPLCQRFDDLCVGGLSDWMHWLFILPGAHCRAQGEERRREGAGDVSERRRCDAFSQKPQLLSVAKPTTSQTRSTSSRPFLRMTELQSCKRRMNRH